MKKLITAAAVAAALATLAACATVEEAPTGAYKVGDAYQVTLGRPWADVSRIMFDRTSSVHVLSIDGPLLNRLYLTEGLAPGGALVRSASKERPTPTYRTDFSPTDTVEFITDSVAALGYEKVETANLRPGKFGDADAIRFDLTAVTKDGLDMSGAALTSQRNGKLYVILYLAPTEHYYADALPEVDSLMGSVSFKRP